MHIFKSALIILFIFLISLPIYRPLFDYGFFPIHDDMQFARVKEMADALRDGQFPVRILKNFGYGYHYALFNYYAPLPYYLGAVFNLIGSDILSSTKLMFFIPNFLSLIFMFFLAKKISKNNLIGLFAAILYAYFPYRAVDTYVRGTIGELYVMMFAPLLILGIINIFENKKIWLFSLSLSGIILSHNIYAYIVFLYLFIFIFGYFFSALFEKRRQNLFFFIKLLLGTATSLGLTAFFWLPAIIESNFTQLSILNKEGYFFGNYFISLKDLWASEWGYGGAAGGTTFMVGKIHLFLGFTALTFISYQIIKKKQINKTALLSLFFFFVAVFFTNKISYFFWEKIPMLSLTQYPMRFIFFIDFFLILFIVNGFLFLKLNKIYLISLISLISLMVIFKNQPFFRSAFNYEFKAEKLLGEKNIRTKISEMSDEYLPRDFSLPVGEFEIAQDSTVAKYPVETKVLEHKSQELIILLNNKQQNNQITFPVANFPGWELFVNSNKQEFFSSGKFKLISSMFNKGNFIVKLKFSDTAIRMIANIVTAITLSIILTYIIYPTIKHSQANL